MRDYLAGARLDGCGYVILGAGGGGIGNATAEALAGAGAKLLCVDIRPDEANAVAEAVGGTPYVADITDRQAVEGIFARAAELFGKNFAGIVDIVGVGRIKAVEDFDDEQLKWQYDITLHHAILATQIGGKLLAEGNGGTITFVGSRAGIKPALNQAIYGAFKAALHHFVRTAAIEYGPRRIRVNAVAPGFVSTPRVRKALDHLWADLERSNPLRRAASPEDVAMSVLYLVSDLAAYVTGNVLTLDGASDNSLQSSGKSFNLSGTGPN